LTSLQGYLPLPRSSLLGGLKGIAAVIAAAGSIAVALDAFGVVGLPPGPTFELEGFSNQIVLLPEPVPPEDLVSDGDSLLLCASQNVYVWVRSEGVQTPVNFNGRLIPRSAPGQMKQVPFHQKLPTALMWWEFPQPLPPGEYIFELIQFGRGSVGRWEVTISCESSSTTVTPSPVIQAPTPPILAQKPTSAELRQWATAATASSEYGNPEWSAMQATGAPNTTSCGDTGAAWAPRSSGISPEWIELDYATPVHANMVRVHETYNSGFIYQVDLKDSSGNLHTVWAGTDTTPCPSWFEITFPKTSFFVQGVKIHARISGWEEIDAVELIGEQAGTVTGEIGELVEVEWRGKWYPAKILDVQGDSFCIHYEGYPSFWDEWVDASRIRRRSP
jgi:hypothetical protein